MKPKALNTLINEFKNSRGRFISIKGYTSSSNGNEVANYLIRIGIGYNVYKRADRISLNSISYTGNKEEMRQCLLNSITFTPNSDTNHTSNKTSYDNKEYYTKSLYKNVANEHIYITGYVVSKTIVSPATELKKVVNSKPETIIKNQIRDELNLKLNKYDKFDLSQAKTIIINKKEILL